MFSYSLKLNTSAFDAQLTNYVARVSKGANDPVLGQGMLDAASEQLKFERQRFYKMQKGGWAPLKPRTVASKKKRGTFVRGTLIDKTSELVRSLSVGAKNNILEKRGDAVAAGSRDPKLQFHQFGTPNMAARTVVAPADAPTVRNINIRLVRAVNTVLGESFTNSI